MYFLNIEGEEEYNLENFSNGDCFNKDWVVSSNTEKRLKNCICLLCHQVANKAMELTCEQHQDTNEPLVIGEECLKRYLQSNNDNCPTHMHEGCHFMKSKFARQQISQLLVICPRQYMLEKEEEKTRKGSIMFTNSEYLEREGDIKNESKCNRVCEFRGQIDVLEKHLRTSCLLSVISCPFKSIYNLMGKSIWICCSGISIYWNKVLSN
ncbi:hypothetical protein RFI_11273 [Reticulomyxa filosa]|uniref:TRAF-type domain-containing protein n=1 Tax=Reticulomyxa filosa TaxID=46433 RepID=X6NJH6_RETFI|nr:hypothetical protein RFI_11273 [Reticulomyxa filosa]|eukprot:ETO25864.1 hypothetical protein RFI_11273 [Reticulomyxa filosa]